jgi:hypothetical protein
MRCSDALLRCVASCVFSWANPPHNQNKMDETVHAPGAQTVIVVRPPPRSHSPTPLSPSPPPPTPLSSRFCLQRRGRPVEEFEGRRTDVVVDTERGMVGSMQRLRIQAVEKNKAFLRRVEELRARIEAVRAQTEVEVGARDRQLAEWRTEVEGGMRTLEDDLLASIEARFERLSTSLVPTREAAEAERAREREFYEKEVPARNEAMVGDLVRRMLRERQSFDVDKVKVRARLRETQERFERWQGATARRRTAEQEDRANVAQRQADHMQVEFARAEEEAATSEKLVQDRVSDVLDRVQATSQRRVAGDEFASDQLQSVMRRIQRQILANFGQEQPHEDEEEEGEEEEGGGGGGGAGESKE